MIHVNKSTNTISRCFSSKLLILSDFFFCCPRPVLLTYKKMDKSTHTDPSLPTRTPVAPCSPWHSARHPWTAAVPHGSPSSSSHRHHRADPPSPQQRMSTAVVVTKAAGGREWPEVSTQHRRQLKSVSGDELTHATLGRGREWKAAGFSCQESTIILSCCLQLSYLIEVMVP